MEKIHLLWENIIEIGYKGKNKKELKQIEEKYKI